MPLTNGKLCRIVAVMLSAALLLAPVESAEAGRRAEQTPQHRPEHSAVAADGIQAPGQESRSGQSVRQQRPGKRAAHNKKRAAARRVAGKRKSVSKHEGMSWVRLHHQFPSAFMLNGPRDKKRVALTFDDVPDPRFTGAVLDILARYDVCATFFIVGDRAAKHPELVARIRREGHVIGNHSYNHAVFSKLSLSQFQKQLWQTDAIIRRITGVSPRLVRPPYGELLPQQVKWSKDNGYTIVNWDVDSEDWKRNPSSARVIANIRKTLQPGSIILQHAGGGEGQDLSGTINALPQLIELLRGKGYELVTLPELLDRKAYR